MHAELSLLEAEYRCSVEELEAEYAQRRAELEMKALDAEFRQRRASLQKEMVRRRSSFGSTGELDLSAFPRTPATCLKASVEGTQGYFGAQQGEGSSHLPRCALEIGAHIPVEPEKSRQSTPCEACCTAASQPTGGGGQGELHRPAAHGQGEHALVATPRSLFGPRGQLHGDLPNTSEGAEHARANEEGNPIVTAYVEAHSSESEPAGKMLTLWEREALENSEEAREARRQAELALLDEQRRKVSSALPQASQVSILML